ncbi:cobyrinate a,c-diamide synthase [Xenorhabdus bovienii]|uniref:cobyrinate a,c-diamide synthase n=1 Tax=Xenorhabdus bovienii TaxID=40576 RepID=UPI0023B2748B|nr:cobyrinate a,c-diamide synthase [Xenorhabdus bovienii]MDE9461862.1 cobyrinate a,c-diamide synthase [Xenorhabdus bovienii]MDE9469018.1 cobyrinate a,c-diamide synthase [Xenorhabdus bovienii]
MRQKYAFVIAGTGSGCGKTTVTLGIMRALMCRQLRVQPFKAGPDYLDGGWHRAVTGVASRNLDAFMLPVPILNGLFNQAVADKDVAVIEGVMGLYDGYGSDPDYCSSAALAKQLGCPVILVVDGKAVSTSIAATVMGFQHFDPSVNIAGVLINRVNHDSHFQLLKQAIEDYCGLPVLGHIPVMPDIALPSRHLGLIPAQERNNQHDEQWQNLAHQIETTVDLDKLLALTPLPTLPQGDIASLVDPASGQGLTLALAEDEAFHFYYSDNLLLLEHAGVAIKRFSPLHDSQLPECQMIYLGGGYPEMYAQSLAANHAMHEALRQAQRKGIAIYAECGGLMYLGEALTDVQGVRHPMVGLIAGESQMGKSLKRFGYCEATAICDTLLVAKGETLRGHEFHYSDFTSAQLPVFHCTKQRSGMAQKSWFGGYQNGNTLAGYLHVHFAQRPDLLHRWLTIAREQMARGQS